MSTFESKPAGQRNRLIWKSIYSAKESFYWSLIAFAFMAVAMIIVSYTVMNGTELSEEKVRIARMIFFLSIFPLIILFFMAITLAYYYISIRFARSHEWQHLTITRQDLTLQKSDGLEININQDEILKIYQLKIDETKALIESGLKPIWNKIKLDVLKIKTKSEDYYIILDVYDEAKLIVAELNELYPIEGFDEYMQKSAD